ncbi:glutathione reductase [Citrobacter koseri]|uniref:Glutathione reductase n=1 Tax=Citrobacter koseri TaxID=545 RepID=A0A447UMB8_CITKO|nr:glutathione reductase [Citrobacter koseri]
MTKHYDYIAIGGGSGGIASINRAAMYGQKCALIEAKELGGTCVNVGCVPKKVMWHAAQIREAIHMYGPDYGFDTTINRVQLGHADCQPHGLYRPYSHLVRQRAG